MFFTSGTVVVPVSALDAVFIIVGDLNGLVPASTLDVVFIAFGVLNGLVWLSLEIFHIDEAENPWVVVVEFNVVDADRVVFPDWEDDSLCNTLEDGETCGVGVVSFTEGELVCSVVVGETRRVAEPEFMKIIDDVP